MTILGLTCIVQRRCSDSQQTAQDRDEKRQEIHLWTHRGFCKDLTYLRRNVVHVDAASRYLEETLSIMLYARPGNGSLQELISDLFEQMTDAAFWFKIGALSCLDCLLPIGKQTHPEDTMLSKICSSGHPFSLSPASIYFFIFCLSLDIKSTATLKFIVSNYIFLKGLWISTYSLMYINLPFSKNNLIPIYTRVTKNTRTFAIAMLPTVILLLNLVLNT